MASFNKRRELPFCPPSIEYFDTFIGNSTEIHGRVVATGSIRIDGKIIGNVESPTDANSSIALGRTGFIHGDIFAQRVMVAGLVKGNIYAKDSIVDSQSKTPYICIGRTAKTVTFEKYQQPGQKYTILHLYIPAH